jgi:thioredoxin reductase
MFDTLIIGGGPAGLQAALTLGRMHRSVLLIDSGDYRNATGRHAHNFLTNDGRDPAELRRIARTELAAYETVEVRPGTVVSVAPDGGGFVAQTDAGTIDARTVVLATGLRDELPDIPGLADLWGDRVAHCPFCHGHEFAGGRIAVLNDGPHAAMQAAMLRPLASEVLTLSPSLVTCARTERSSLTGPQSDDLSVLAQVVLQLRDGTEERVSGVFVAPVSSQRAPFAADLGLRMQESGAVWIDALGRTSLDGVYAAGDLAHTDAFPGPLASLAAATAAGQLAAVAIVQRFVAEEVGASDAEGRRS